MRYPDRRRVTAPRVDTRRASGASLRVSSRQLRRSAHAAVDGTASERERVPQSRLPRRSRSVETTGATTPTARSRRRCWTFVAASGLNLIRGSWSPPAGSEPCTPSTNRPSSTPTLSSTAADRPRRLLRPTLERSNGHTGRSMAETSRSTTKRPRDVDSRSRIRCRSFARSFPCSHLPASRGRRNGTTLPRERVLRSRSNGFVIVRRGLGT